MISSIMVSSLPMLQFQIPLKKDLPVGNNLHDHVTTMMGPFLVSKPVLFDIVRSATPSVIWDFLRHGTGPMTATASCDAIGSLKTQNQGLSDVQYIISGVSTHGDYGTFFGKSFGLPQSFTDKFSTPYHGTDAATILPVILHPKSGGTLRLKSANPFEKPLIDPKYLDHPHDLQTLVNGKC